MALDDTEWNNESVTDVKLNILSFFSFTNLAAFPSSNFGVGAKGMAEDTGEIYQNTGTFATPVWTSRINNVVQRWTLLDSHTATGTESSYTFTPSTALNLLTDYSAILVFCSFDNNAVLAYQVVLNGIVTAYVANGWRSDGTALTNISTGSSTSFQLLGTSAVLAEPDIQHGMFEIMLDEDQNAHITSKFHSNTREETMHGSRALAADTISSIKVQVSTSTWKSGGIIDTYGVKKIA